MGYEMHSQTILAAVSLKIWCRLFEGLEQKKPFLTKNQTLLSPWWSSDFRGLELALTASITCGMQTTAIQQLADSDKVLTGDSPLHWPKGISGHFKTWRLMSKTSKVIVNVLKQMQPSILCISVFPEISSLKFRVKPKGNNLDFWKRY